MYKFNQDTPYGVIYALFSTRNPEDYRYVGLTMYKMQLRMHQHKSRMNKNSKSYVHKWWRKEIADGYSVDYKILHVVQEHESINELEKQYITQFLNEGYRLTNLTEGGEGAPGYRFSDEQKQAQSIRNKELHQKNPEIKEKIKASLQKYQEEHPEEVAAQAEAGRKWAEEHPEHRKNHSEFVKQWYVDNPDFLPQRTEKRKQQYFEKLQSVENDSDLGWGGVTWEKKHKKWQARMQNNLLGYFDNEEDAIRMRKRAEAFILNGGTIKEFKDTIRKTPEEIKESYEERGRRTREKNRT